MPESNRNDPNSSMEAEDEKSIVRAFHEENRAVSERNQERKRKESRPACQLSRIDSVDSVR